VSAAPWCYTDDEGTTAGTCRSDSCSSRLAVACPAVDVLTDTQVLHQAAA
jgi:hypothetical protein